MFFSILPGCSNNGHRHMHACSIYKEWKRFRKHNTKEVKWCKKTMFTSDKHGNQVTGVQISYIQMVREKVVRVLDFAQCENLKRGQENRGHAASKKIDKGKLLSDDVYFSILPGCSNNGHHHMHAVSTRVEEIPGAQYERSQVV